MNPVDGLQSSNSVTPNVASTLSRTSAEQRIVKFMGHAIEMLHQLKEQNRAPEINLDEKKLKDIYTKAQAKIYAINSRIHNKIHQVSPKQPADPLNLSEKEFKDLKKQLKNAEKEIVKIIRETQLEVAAEIGAQQSRGKVADKDIATVRSKVATLARGGWSAKIIYFLSFVSKVNDTALEVFAGSQQAMQQASKKEFVSNENESQVEKDKRAEFEAGNLDRRAGVIGLNGIYRFQVAFSEKEIHKQFKSFVAQDISYIERTSIEREITIDKESFTSKIIPLNKEFDLHMGISGVLTAVFTNLFGTRGISSANRQEPHLINGWETNLIQNGKTIFRALRHAILSDKYEKDATIREKNSRQAALELIQAALLEEIKTQGLTIEEAQKKGITLNLNSISLVTPDDVRPHLPGQANEKKMLLDQVLGLQSFNGQQEIELDDIKIKVNVSVNTFNFGVNALADTYQMGLENQYKHNLKAMKGFREHFKKFNNEIDKERAEITQKLKNLQPQDPQYQILIDRKIAVGQKKEEARQLMRDIELLMKNKKAYLKGDNQYEIGAKILNLNSLMDQTIETINQTREPINRISGFKGAFNCMSGKDRTGWMDAVAKTFAIMAASRNGYYVTHQQFIKKPELRQKFAEILEKVLLEAGNLEITELNTGAKGYKVKSEARLFGMSAEAFLQAQGLSATTSS